MGVVVCLVMRWAGPGRVGVRVIGVSSRGWCSGDWGVVGWLVDGPWWAGMGG